LRFRILVDEPKEGALNMAVDEALFLSAGESPDSATVRLYGFDPPAVSFGYRQKPEEAIDLASCRRLGVDWVRRPTGGRALLHQHELTYSVASSTDGVFRGLGVRALYDSVSAVLRRALTGLGIALDPALPEAGPSRAPALHVPCLAVPGRHELTSEGRKVVASAQRRGRRAFLQHGSILRAVDSDLWAKVQPRGRPETALRAVGIDELTPATVSRNLLICSVLAAFEGLFEAEGQASGLSRRELARIEELQRKYRSEGATG
jgi:lipoate-protein ligase A